MVFNEKIQSKLCSKEKSYEKGEAPVGINDIELGGVEEPATTKPDSPKANLKDSLQEDKDTTKETKETKDEVGSSGDNDDDDEPGPYFEGLKWSSVVDEGYTGQLWWIFTYPINLVFR
jgi:hypothetical protein